jgi:HSP20 family molecular chaperone IbpA
MATNLPIKKTESIFDELNKMQDRIMHRAYSLFETRGKAFGRDLEHWLDAERELIWKPSVELTEKDNQFNLSIAVPGVDPKDIDIEVTPDYLLVKAESRHEHREDEGEVHVCEFEAGNLFRSIRFPKAINTDQVKVEFKNGVLQISASIAAEAQSRKIALKASG